MSRMQQLERFDLSKSVAGDAERKRQFHRFAKRQLQVLAGFLGFIPGEYDIRSNPGGPAVSGEIILHADRLYVQVSHSCMGFDRSVLFRTCNGRKDYRGGPNNFAPLDLLHEPQELAFRIRAFCRVRSEAQ